MDRRGPRRGVCPTRIATLSVLAALIVGLGCVRGGAALFAQHCASSPTLSTAARVAGFTLERVEELPAARRVEAVRAASHAAESDRFLLQGAQARAVAYRALVNRPQWDFRLRGASSVVLMIPLTLPQSYPGMVSGSYADVWMVEFTHVWEPVVGGTWQPSPDFRAVYAAVDVATDQALVAFAARQRV